jgi:hypothetical protein
MAKPKDAGNPLSLLIRAEAAGALGQSGRRLKRAMETLRAFDRGERKRGSKPRESLVRDAADALYNYVVQKELLGVADQEIVTRVYGVTPEIWKLMGVRKRENT